MVIRRELLEKWFIKLAALWVLVFEDMCAMAQGANVAVRETNATAPTSTRFQRFLENRVQTIPRVTVQFTDGNTTIRVVSYLGRANETLYRSLTRAGVRFWWDRRYRDFVTDVAKGRVSLHCSKDPQGNRTIDEGSRQLVFYVNGVAFAANTVKTATIPPVRNVSIVVSLESFDSSRVNYDMVIAFFRVLTGAPV